MISLVLAYVCLMILSTVMVERYKDRKTTRSGWAAVGTFMISCLILMVMTFNLIYSGFQYG